MKKKYYYYVEFSYTDNENKHHIANVYSTLNKKISGFQNLIDLTNSISVDVNAQEKTLVIEFYKRLKRGIN